MNFIDNLCKRFFGFLNVETLVIQSDNDNQKKFPINDLPDSLLLNIFSYAFPAELCRMERVSTRFKRLTSNDALWNRFTVKTLYPWSYVIDATVWAHPDLQTNDIDTKGGNVQPIGNKALVRKHVQDLTREVAKTGNGEFVYMLIPKGISLNKMRAIAAAASTSEGGDGALVKEVWGRIITRLGDIEVEETRIVALSTSVLRGSRGKSFVDQQALLGEGFEVAQVLEATMLHIIMKIIFSKCLYKDRPTYMRSDQRIGGRRLTVGGDPFRGLDVHHGYYSEDRYVGIASLRKF